MSPPQEKPVLFLHIPKTAGTSFLLTLRNTFGDRFVHRFDTPDESVPEELEALIAAGPQQVGCITGHLPFHLLQPHLEQLRIFTVLRHPAERVLSLDRFLRERPAAERDRLGLSGDFSVADLLESRHPELFVQMHDGMVRMLAGAPALLDPDRAEFWQDPPEPVYLRAAQVHLQAMAFGTTEDMPQTLRRAREAWSVPYALRAYRENASVRPAAEADIGTLQRIMASNTLDLALYHWACRHGRDTSAAAVEAGSEAVIPLGSVFRPPLGIDVRLSDVPGRCGFHEFEDIGLAWLHEAGPAEVHFLSAAGRRRLRLRLHTVSSTYPTDRMRLRINARAVDFALQSGEPCWYVAVTDPFDVEDGLNVLQIDCPLFVPAATLHPGSADARKLGLAASHIGFEAA